MPKLIIFGTHNLQTSRQNTLVSELLLMQFITITGSDDNYHHTTCQQKKHACIIFSMQFERQ